MNKALHDNLSTKDKRIALLESLLDDIYDALDDYVDVDDCEDGSVRPNFAMNIRTEIDEAMGRGFWK